VDIFHDDPGVDLSSGHVTTAINTDASSHKGCPEIKARVSIALGTQKVFSRNFKYCGAGNMCNQGAVFSMQ
jgi:hypothetical protein